MHLKGIFSVLFVMILSYTAVMAQDEKTTMDSLEARVWVREVPLYKRTAMVYMQFRNDTIMMRVYENGQWDKILYWSFYFYTPGDEDLMWDIAAEYYPVFNPARLGKRKNGKYFIYQYNLDWSNRKLVDFYEITKLTDDELHLKRPKGYEGCLIINNSFDFKAYDGPFPSGN